MNTAPVVRHSTSLAKARQPIELRVTEPRQLFETLDPFPFRERDLDRNAEQYIVAWARELPATSAIRIVVHLPASHAHDQLASELNEAFARFFGNRATGVELDLKELFRVGRLSLGIGASVLIASMIAAQQIHYLLQPPLSRIVEESLVILGWVANWRTLEILLYEWWPLLRRRNLYRRLATAKVEVRSTSVD